MAGLLGMMDDPQSQGLLSLGLRLMSTPGNFGSALGQAGLGAMGDMQQAQLLQEQRKRQEQASLMQKLQLEQIIQQQKRQEQLRELAAASARSPQQMALQANGGPTLAAAGAVPTTSPGFDYQGYAQGLAALGDPAGALAIQQALKKEQPKFSTAPQYDQNGRAFILSESGQIKYLDGVKSRDKIVRDDNGGQSLYRTEYNPTPISVVNKTATPGDLLQNGVAWANVGTARDRLAWDKGGGADIGSDPAQAQLIKRFGKPEAGRRWKADGSLEVIPGSSVDTKTQASEMGKGSVGDVISSLRDMYNQLDESGGVTNPDKGVFSNVAAGTASSGIGQATGRLFGTQNQSLRNTIAQQRPLLLQAIMKASGMSAKQMDSNAEMKLYLATATDPTLDVAANRRALDMLESLYGKPGGSAPAGGPNAPGKVMRFDAKGNPIP